MGGGVINNDNSSIFDWQLFKNLNMQDKLNTSLPIDQLLSGVSVQIFQQIRLELQPIK